MQRLWKALAIFAAIAAIAGFALAVLQAPAIIENDHRLAPTMAVAHGYLLYYGLTQGPVLSTIYGPITALVYAPALLARTPMAAVRLGTAIALILYFCPFFVIARASGRPAKLPWQTYIYLLGLAAALTFFSESLTMSSSLVHADAPALAAAALACWLCGWKGLDDRLRAVLSGALAIAAILSKQNMLPLLPALACWWLLFSRKDALLFLAGAALSALAAGAIVIRFAASPQAAWFDLFEIVRHQPYDKASAFPVADSLTRTLSVYLLTIAGSLFAYWQAFRKQPSRANLRHSVILLLWVGCCLVPTSLLGRIKAGGNENALSPAIYFLALASFVELSRSFLEPDDQPGASQRVTSLAVLILVLGLFVGVKLPQYVYLLSKGVTTSSMETVYRYSLAHPGQMYFPQFPLTILMSEGRLYHFSWGLSDRRAAGYPLTDADFRRDIPPTAQAMALVPWVRAWEGDIYSRCYASARPEPSLPGFEVCMLH